jgi:hypothetical protein
MLPAVEVAMRLRHALLLVPLLLAGRTQAADAGPHKLALLINIAAYPESSGYRQLHTQHDVELLETALVRQGFKKGDIVHLSDEQATKDGIVAAFQALTAKAQAGDIVEVHYSGHGHQITDDNGDEIDGYDEVLVPYGAPAHMDGGYDGSKHLRDDDLGKLVDNLRRKVGPSGDVLLTIDACHSGSITRGGPDEPAARGGVDPIGPPAATAKKAGSDSAGGGLLEGAGTAGEAPFVVISAARHDETAMETRDSSGEAVGALTLALTDALSQTRKDATYRALFSRIRQDMAVTVPKQTPQLEGDVDTLVFDGQAIEQAPYLRVTGVTDRKPRLDGGQLIGLMPGTEIAFHAEGTTDPKVSTPLATGKVTRSNETMAEITLDGTPSQAVLDKLASSWAFVSKFAYGDMQVRVVIDPALPKGVKDAMTATLGGVGAAELATDAPDVSIVAADGARVRLVAADGAAVGEPFSASDAAALTEAVKSFARSRYVRGLDMRDAAVHVALELVPATVKIDDFDGSCGGYTELPSGDFQQAGSWTFQEGDWYLLRFKNDGTLPAYVTVLDVMPDGSIAQLYPAPGQKGTDNLLKAGASYVAQDICLQVTPPFGTDMLKLFATRTKVDFEPILTAKKPEEALATRGGPVNPLEEMMADTMAITTRGAAPSAPRESGSTDAVAVKIVPRTP